MSNQNSQLAKNERVSTILEMLLEGQPRNKIADQFGYSTWKSLDIYMRRQGFTWNGQRQIYTKSVPDTTPKEEINPSNAAINPEDVTRLFSIGILDAREIAKRTGFSGHKEMAAYMLRNGYVWSSSSLNYVNSNPSPPKESSNCNSKDSLHIIEEVHTDYSLAGNIATGKYNTLLEFLWESRDKLFKIIESMSIGDNIRVYNIPGQAKTKSIYLSDSLTDLMTTLCQEHSLSQKQGYEAALVEYLSKYGFQDKIEELLKVQ